MIWGRIQSNWNHYKVAAKAQWGKLSDEQLDGTHGDRAHLGITIEQAYGLAKEDVERQLAGWQGLQTDREPSPFGRRT
jgi:uncharacterized protein YjbJ (UPF0337 family)